GEAVRQGERELLRGRGARLADVVSGDRDGIPQGRVLGAPLEAVDDETERGLDGEAPGMLRHVLLEDVVLDRPTELVGRHPLFFGGGDIKGPENDRGAVDR